MSCLVECRILSELKSHCILNEPGIISTEDLADRTKEYCVNYIFILLEAL